MSPPAIERRPRLSTRHRRAAARHAATEPGRVVPLRSQRGFRGRRLVYLHRRRRHPDERPGHGDGLPAGPLRIANIGSGGGFPGIPFAIYRPECTVDLIESHQRKAVFLREAIREQTNVRVLARRAEEVTDSYDWTISRAVRTDEVLKLNLALHTAVLGAEGESLPWGEKRALFVR